MDETRLKTVIAEKDLGIYFESNLSFAEYIASKVKNLRGRPDSEIVHLSR